LILSNFPSLAWGEPSTVVFVAQAASSAANNRIGKMQIIRLTATPTAVFLCQLFLDALAVKSARAG
jgi:tRNA A37 threonylcarbamoyladenosine synthetase subunit TsaC/SUA5/YrdC